MPSLPALRENLHERWSSSRYRRVFLGMFGYILVVAAVVISINSLSSPLDHKTSSLNLTLTEAEPTPTDDPVTKTATQPVQSDPQKNVTAAPLTDVKEPYMAPFDRNDRRPRISLIIKGLGLKESLTQQAILELPPAITLAFSPYSKTLPFWIEQSRAKRHESLIEIPMEPRSFPEIDPGPQGLYLRRPWIQNINQLDQIAAASPYHLGYINAFGNNFLNSSNRIKQFFDWVKTTESIFVEDMIDRTNTLSGPIAKQVNLNYMASPHNITDTATPDEMMRALQALEKEALKNGFALGTASAYPVTLETIKKWSAELAGRGIALAPLSAVLERKENETRIQDSTL
jgi:polysaccharide deacetylase 2 family uncharacterized protein YibQ